MSNLTTDKTPRSLLQQAASDFAAESAELYALLKDVDTAIWTEVSTFKSWTVWDVIAHLHFSDHMALTSLSSAEEFRELMKRMREQGSAHVSREWLRSNNRRDPTGPELLFRWHDTWNLLVERLGQADPSERFVWAGPGMKARMFATARQMETWAHGWEIYDLMGLEREHHGRLINIATIGVRTFAWTFTNRGLEIPSHRPAIKLTAPTGEIWDWPSEPAMAPDATEEMISGSAVEFCQVVTQVRNVADTQLHIQGDTAHAWMAIAQCFAGPPEEPPEPGSRTN